ncbi:hypothetical protein IEO21_09268 [Rhodonia placenta]|uniref:Uncharacterized protein n=1 Tax=Rhodonia placenta TaxID=104341 RepID=A0A8H7NUR6_9APHY|nr:hypothetical protein IEO21_09268 [Postia placenta]
MHISRGVPGMNSTIANIMRSRAIVRGVSMMSLDSIYECIAPPNKRRRHNHALNPMSRAQSASLRPSRTEDTG